MKDNHLLTVCIPCYNAQNTIGRCIESILNQTYPLSILIVNDGSKDNSGQVIDLLTVCIPCYNAQNTIGRCIESILNQTYPLSILIVNDGSKDNSGQVIDEYASKYDNITVIHQENAGIAKTRNVLLANVETPYFGFLDADDQALPTYSDVFIPLLEKSPQMAVANFNWITSKDKNVETPYFGFLDADDQALPTYSDVFIPLLEKSPQMAVANFNWITSKDKIVYHDGPYDYGKDMVVHLFSTLWNKVYNKAFITSIGLTFPNGNRYEDSHMIMAKIWSFTYFLLYGIKYITKHLSLV